MSLYDNRKYISAINGNIAHTCGNICSIIIADVESKFRPGFFKNIHRTTELAVSQFKKIKSDLTDLKWEKPYLIVKPKLLIADPTDNHFDITRRMYGTSLYDITRETEETAKFFCDESKGILLDYAMERTKMSFDFTLELSTEYQQYNISAEFVNKFRLESPYYKPVVIETIIPDRIIEKISEDSGIPILDKNKSPNTFLTYLNDKSRIPITLEYQPATGKYRFRLMGAINLLMKYTNLDIPDGDNDNMTPDKFPITFSVHMEFNYPSRFFYVTDKDNSLMENFKLNKPEIEDFEEETGFFYTLQNCIIPDNDVNDKQLKIVLALEVENEEYDTIDLNSLIDEEMNSILKNLEKDELDLKRFINIIVYENEDPFDERKYNFDLYKRELILRDTKKYNTYRIAFYVDNVMLNEYKLRNYKYD